MKSNSQADMNWACPQFVNTENAPPECGSFCADWDGTGDTSQSWCFVNRIPATERAFESGQTLKSPPNQCTSHLANVNGTFGPMEPSTEACKAMTILKFPWSGMVGRGISVIKMGMGLTSAMAAAMYFCTIASWFIIWCTP